MAKYRKKPVVIEAKQVLPRRVKQIAEWCGGTVLLDGHKYVGVIISTLEGKMTADIGDFIIKGVQGEFYPCKSDIFEQTYEPVTE